MVFIKSAPYFCMPTKMVIDIANDSTTNRHAVQEHPLESKATTCSEIDSGDPIPETDYQCLHNLKTCQSTLLEQVDIYLDNFISIVQRGPTKWRQMLHHLFHAIYCLFRPNVRTNTNHKDPISRK